MSTPLTHPDVDVAANHPAANLASRDNIVADGPGTVADFLPAAEPDSTEE